PAITPTATAAPKLTAAAPAAPPPAPPVADLDVVPPAPDPALPAWAVSTRETGLWSGPSQATPFTTIPAGATVRAMDRQESRFRVSSPGDRTGRKPGEAWMDAADLTAAAWPRWIRLRRPASIVTKPSSDAVPL